MTHQFIRNQSDGIANHYNVNIPAKTDFNLGKLMGLNFCLDKLNSNSINLLSIVRKNIIIRIQSLSLRISSVIQSN